MSVRQFRVGIIGLGMMGHSLAQTCQAEEDVKLVAGCDVAAAARQAWGTAYGVDERSLHANVEAMFEREHLDIIMVATHAPAHHQQVIAAARRGIHVFCEKPLAISLQEADEMVEVCANAKVRLAVNHVKRGSRGTAIALAQIADGAIGTPYLFRGEGKGGRWAGSELMEMGTHLFDWLRALAGDPLWLFADVVQHGHPAGASDILHSLELPYPERDCGLVLGERAFCALGLPAGIHADIGFLSQPSGSDVGYGFDICGTEGTLALRYGLATTIFLQRAHHRGPVGAGAWEPIPVDEFVGLTAPVRRGGPDDKRLACQRRLLRDFLDSIVEDREPCSSGRDGLAALELSMAVWESQRLGCPVTLPLPSRSHPLARWRADA
jgi:predicted dehydrogenase